jgi:hypothetical protein
MVVSPEALLEEMMRQWLPNGDYVADRDKLASGAEWDSWTYRDIRHLYMMCRQWEVDFTPARASAEVEYQGVFQFFANIVEPAWIDRQREIAEHEELVEAANNVMKALVDLDDFLLICRAAGISESELAG